MEKKVILITGTNSGFGWLAAVSCAAAGHKVYATMRDTKGRNADKAKALGQQANIEVLDVDSTSGKSVTDAEAGGGIDHKCLERGRPVLFPLSSGLQC